MPPRVSPALSRLTATTIGATLVLIALGGLVRATDNGLACPDWPTCYGRWLPGAADLPEGLTLFSAWSEHAHRLVAMVVGLLVAAIALWVLARHRRRPDLLWPAVAAGVAVNLQAALGQQVVARLLRAELVTAHLGLAMLILGALLLLRVNLTHPRPTRAERARLDLRLARVSAGVTALAFAQMLVGAHVTGVGAGLAYPDFPWYDGAAVPRIATAAEAWHVAHRLLAYALAGGVVYLLVRALRHRRELEAAGLASPSRHRLVRLPQLAVALVAAQIAIGAANLASGLSPWTVTPHLVVASWIWTVLVLGTVVSYRLAVPAAAVAPSLALAPAQRVGVGGAAG